MTDLTTSAPSTRFFSYFSPSSFAWLILLVTIVVSSLIGPMIYPYAYDKINFRSRNQGPSLIHPLGTDQLGRDTLARILRGGRLSVAVALTGMIFTLLLGTLIGLFSGYYTRLDALLMWLTDVFLALPTIPLLLLMILLLRESLSQWLGQETGMFLLIVTGISITSWMPSARVIRAEVLKLKRLPFVEAALSVGCSHTRVLFKHILENTLPLIFISSTFCMANAIVIESSLSFLGMGFPPDYPTWGRLLYDASEYIQLEPLRSIWPGLAISLTVLSINALGESLKKQLTT